MKRSWQLSPSVELRCLTARARSSGPITPSYRDWRFRARNWRNLSAGPRSIVTTPSAPRTWRIQDSGNSALSLAVHQADAFINGLGISVFPRQPLDGETPSLDFPGFRFFPGSRDQAAGTRVKKSWRL